MKSALTRQSIVAAMIVMSMAVSVASAQTGSELLLKPWPKDQLIQASADAAFFNSEHTTEGNSFAMAFYNSNGRARVWPGQRADPRFGYDVTYLNLNTTSPNLPSKFVDTSVGFGMGIADFNGWLVGATIGVGYAAAGAFDDGNAYYMKGDILVGRQLNDTDSIGAVLDYDGNRTLLPDWPLPGFLYTHQIDPTIILGLGFPFSSITWKPPIKYTFDRQLTIDAKYAIPDDADVRVDYELINNLGLFAEYGLRQEAFHYDALPKADDRVLFQQRRIEAGVRWTPIAQISVTVAGGYAFSQEFNVGFDIRDMDRLAKPFDAPYARVGLEIDY